MKRVTRTSGLAVTLATCAAGACVAPGPVAHDEIGGAEAAFSAPGLFDELEEIEDLLPAPTPSGVIEVGTFDAATGEFAGLTSTPPYYDPEIGRVIPGFPGGASLHAVHAILRFRVVNRGGQSVRVTSNGRLALMRSDRDYVDLNVGLDDDVSWRISTTTRSYDDRLLIRRSGVDGLGAFEIPAFPTGLLYEPPVDAEGTNRAMYSHETQRSSITSVGSSSSSSTSRPKFATVDALRNGIVSLVGKFEDSFLIKSKLNLIGGLIGSVSEEVTEGTTISGSNTLELSMSTREGFSTNSMLGPGHGDVISYLKNARFAWFMVDGKVSLTLIDFETEAYRSASQLRADLESLRTGGTAGFTGLDQDTLEALLASDPFVADVEAPMDDSRYDYVTTIEVGGVSVTRSVSHTHSSTDRSASESFRTRVRSVEGHEIPILGFGTSSSTTTTTMRMSSSRSTTIGETISTAFTLGARPDESYTVEVYYDRIFGTFALRHPPRCPYFDPSRPDGTFCTAECTCSEGEGDCDRDSDCDPGLRCIHDQGPMFGLPGGWDVCLPGCLPFDPDRPNGTQCTSQCRCGAGEGDCDRDSDCRTGLVCAHDVGARYGFPASWDFCERPRVIFEPIGTFIAR